MLANPPREQSAWEYGGKEQRHLSMTTTSPEGYKKAKTTALQKLAKDQSNVDVTGSDSIL